VIRPIAIAEVSAVADLWHDGWHEAHAAHVPAELVTLRTLDSFLQRLNEIRETVRVIGPPGAPLGFCATKGNEIYQLFTAAAARGTGIAAELISDGEARLFGQGHSRIELGVIPENVRAIRFYARQGWATGKVVSYAVDTSKGPFQLPVLIMHKTLTPPK